MNKIQNFLEKINLKNFLFSGEQVLKYGWKIFDTNIWIKSDDIRSKIK